METVIREINRRMPALVLRRDEAMSRHCSFRIGGPVAVFAEPASAQQARELLALLHELGETPLLVGNGTNLLVTDAPLERVAVHFGSAMSRVEWDGDATLTAESGVTLASLAVTAASHGLAGLEFAHGIPGSLGGAAVMNAGAYGGEMRDVLIAADFCDLDGTAGTLNAQSLGFGYRRSAFSDGTRAVLGCTLRLTHGDAQEIRGRMRELSEKRRSSQPLNLPSAGSTFKRPQGAYAAALIDQAGLKGYAVGGAQVSEKHAGFVVNRGGASFSDVMAVMEHVRETVLRTSGIELEPEVRIVRG